MTVFIEAAELESRGYEHRCVRIKNGDSRAQTVGIAVDKKTHKIVYITAPHATGAECVKVLWHQLIKIERPKSYTFSEVQEKLAGMEHIQWLKFLQWLGYNSDSFKRSSS